MRAFAAIGFGFTPGVAGRFGDAALTVVAVGLAVFVFAVVGMLLRAGRSIEWPLLADAIALLVLVPVLVMASGIEVADERLGGRSSNFLAAAAAAVLVYLIVVVIATRGGADRNPASQVGALPGALSIVIVLLGAEHFSASTIWRGLSIAWMIAALATVIAAFVSERFRPVIAPAALALVVVGVMIAGFTGDSERSLSSGSSGIAVLASALIATVLVLIPLRPRDVATSATPPVE